MESGKKRKNSRYAVIVCSKCRQHAQITETGKKTMKCQHCGALLETRKLRVFHISEELEDAVLFRTRLQAELSGKSKETFSLTSPSIESEHRNPEIRVKVFNISEKNPIRNSPHKEDPKSILLEILKTAGGKIEKEELQQKALGKGITQKKFETAIKNLLETGELYSPQPGVIKIVQGI